MKKPVLALLFALTAVGFVGCSHASKKRGPASVNDQPKTCLSNMKKLKDSDNEINRMRQDGTISETQTMLQQNIQDNRKTALETECDSQKMNGKISVEWCAEEMSKISDGLENTAKMKEEKMITDREFQLFSDVQNNWLISVNNVCSDVNKAQ